MYIIIFLQTNHNFPRIKASSTPQLVRMYTIVHSLYSLSLLFLLNLLMYIIIDILKYKVHLEYYSGIKHIKIFLFLASRYTSFLPH